MAGSTHTHTHKASNQCVGRPAWEAVCVRVSVFALCTCLNEWRRKGWYLKCANSALSARFINESAAVKIKHSLKFVFFPSKILNKGLSRWDAWVFFFSNTSHESWSLTCETSGFGVSHQRGAMNICTPSYMSVQSKLTQLRAVGKQQWNGIFSVPCVWLQCRFCCCFTFATVQQKLYVGGRRWSYRSWQQLIRQPIRTQSCFKVYCTQGLVQGRCPTYF